MVHKSVLECIGHTPVVELQRVGKETGCRFLAKLEYVNPGGSVKSRTAYWMVKTALEKGVINQDSILVEMTSGNQGIGIAMVGAALGMQVRIILPEGMSQEREQFMKAYGAEVIRTPAGRDIAEAINTGIALAKKMQAEDPRVYWINQFGNPANPEVHRLATGKEILDQVDGPIDGFVSGIGTGGTITGIGQTLRQRFPNVMVIAAEPENAAILSGGVMGNHIQQGIGDGIIPDVLDQQVINKIVIVTDEHAQCTAREIARKEGMFVGVSSGTNVWAAMQVAKEVGPGKTFVVLLPDGGERYLSCGLVE